MCVSTHLKGKKVEILTNVSKKGALYLEILYPNSPAMHFFKLSASRYVLRISNELLFIIIAEGAAKLYPVKYGSLKRLLTGQNQTPFY